jgi:tetratricopeptide (TPR) repeat protein
LCFELPTQKQKNEHKYIITLYIMTTKRKSANKELEVGEIVSKSEQFIEKYQKKIIYGIAAVALIVGSILGVKHGYLVPLEKKAVAAMFKGELYFGRDSFALALYGNGADYPGFESIISDYGITRSGNLAKAYAGVCYFRLGEPEKAIGQLKSYSGKDKMVSSALTGLIGDCYVNMGNVKEGISYFERAAGRANNEIVSPTYLKKAGIAYESLGQYNDAVKVYTTIKEKYLNSEEASDIDKYITRASELSGK